MNLRRPALNLAFDELHEISDLELSVAFEANIKEVEPRAKVASYYSILVVRSNQALPGMFFLDACFA